MARSLLTTLKALLLLAFFVLPAYAAGKTNSKPEPKAPSWQQLSPQQKQVLGELEPQWEQQPDRLRNNLVKVANKYPKMKPEEQERVRRRITRWASLTPEQRQAARERYKQLKKQPPEKQKEVKKKWESYQSQRGQPSTDAPLRDGSTGHPLPPAAPLK
jgi:type I site-specific restriction-modification system R (restriction) subunit